MPSTNQKPRLPHANEQISDALMKSYPKPRRLVYLILYFQIDISMANQFPLPTPLPPQEPLPPAPPPAPSTEAPLPPPEENPAVPPAYQPPQPVTAPPVKSSPFRFLVPAVIGLLIIGGLIFGISRLFGAFAPKTTKTGETKVTTINYWGLWESPDIMKPVIEAFQADNPNIKVNYQLQSYQDYQDRLQTAMAGGSSPDVARIHSTWLPIFITNLLPAPANTVSASEIQTNFYPVVGNTLIVSNQVFGVPMNLDGLVLFVNNDHLRQAGVTAPATWEDISGPNGVAQKLTLRDQVTGKITRAGIALGTTTNVRFWPDIVTLMLIQGGANLLNFTPADITGVLGPYTSFAAQGKYWDETMPDSVVAFANGKVSIIFAPLWVIPEIQAINPSLSWQVVPVPQLPDVSPINWVSMWTEVVPKNAPHPTEAWKFVSFLASARAQQLLFESAVRERGLAQVPANKAVAQLASQNPFASALIPGLPNAKTFYTADYTRDNETALNSRLVKYLEDAVNAAAKKQDAEKIAQTLNAGFNQVLSQYRLVTPMPTPTAR